MIAYISYAFALGLVAAVNPCGFPMLPAYLSIFVGADQTSSTVRSRLGRAISSSAVVSIGFAAVFAVLGSLFDAGLTAFMTWVPWLMIGLGTAFVGMGLIGLVSGHLAIPLPQRTWHRRGRGPWTLVGFGISYALASLTCSLPIFLAGVAGAFTRVGWSTGFLTFLAYAAGMSTVLLIVSVALALARTSIISALRTGGRHLERVSSAILLIVGGYLAFYWIVDLTGSSAPGPLSAVESFEGSLEAFLAGHRSGLAIVGAITVVGFASWGMLRGTKKKDDDATAAGAADRPAVVPTQPVMVRTQAAVAVPATGTVPTQPVAMPTQAAGAVRSWE